MLYTCICHANAMQRVLENVLLDVVENHIVKHQLDSFNNFINCELNNIVRSESSTMLEYEDGSLVVSLGGAQMASPTITYTDLNGIIRESSLLPSEARYRELNYNGDILVNVYISANDRMSVLYNVPIASHPVMVGSDACCLKKLSKSEKLCVGEDEYDKGGYFIVSGNARTLATQVRDAYNTTHVFEKTKGGKTHLISELRSMSSETGHSMLVQIHQMVTFNNIPFSAEPVERIYDCRHTYVSLPQRDCNNIMLPYVLAILFLQHEEVDVFSLEPTDELIEHLGVKWYVMLRRIVGYEPEFKQVIDSILDEMLLFFKMDGLKIMRNQRCYMMGAVVNKKTKTQSKDDVSSTDTACGKNIYELIHDFFPHLGVVYSPAKIIIQLGLMLRSLVLVSTGLKPIEDKYHVGYKRYDASGALCADLFSKLLKQYLKSVRHKLQRMSSLPSDEEIKQVMLGANSIITSKLRFNFATGEWVYQQGVSQVMQPHTSHWSYFSAMRKVVIQVGKDSKNQGPRQIHPSSAPFICPVETPEGAQHVGVVNHLALGATLTSSIFLTCMVTDLINSYLLPLEFYIDKLKKRYHGEYLIVVVNGKPVGITNTPELIIQKCKHYDHHVAVTKKGRYLYIRSDGSRLVIPLVDLDLVKEGYPCSDLNSALLSGCIKYVDPFELQEHDYSFHPDGFKRFSLLHAITLLGTQAATIPYSNHTALPRNCYLSAMMKQAIGIYSEAADLRCEATTYTLPYIERPIVDTCVGRKNPLPAGQNLCVAVASHTGFNQEDSVIINKSSIQRGMSYVYSEKTISTHEKTGEVISQIPEESKQTGLDYSKLGTRGIVKVGSLVDKKTVVVGKLKGDRCCSVAIKLDSECGTVSRIIDTITQGGVRIVNVVVRRYRETEIGDKYCSNAAQKGTCGLLLNQEDMPFSSDGLVPDLIINPLAFPSRMTLNQLISSAAGIISCYTGKPADATPFVQEPNVIDTLVNRLNDLGLNGGKRVMYCGLTGRKLESTIFVGPTYYHRLKHLVSDKISSRDQGKIDVLTKQPVSGRSKNGGLRVSILQLDALAANGASNFIHEKINTLSDKFDVDVCSSCHKLCALEQMGTKASKVPISLCCKKIAYNMNFPYASKVFFQLLMGMGICPNMCWE